MVIERLILECHVDRRYLQYDVSVKKLSASGCARSGFFRSGGLVRKFNSLTKDLANLVRVDRLSQGITSGGDASTEEDGQGEGFGMTGCSEGCDGS